MSYTSLGRYSLFPDILYSLMGTFFLFSLIKKFPFFLYSPQSFYIYMSIYLSCIQPPFPSLHLPHSHLQVLCSNCDMEDLNIMISALGGEPALKDQELFLLKGESRIGIAEREKRGRETVEEEETKGKERDEKRKGERRG